LLIRLCSVSFLHLHCDQIVIGQLASEKVANDIDGLARHRVRDCFLLVAMPVVFDIHKVVRQPVPILE
jgi:hypothetical protein